MDGNHGLKRLAWRLLPLDREAKAEVRRDWRATAEPASDEVCLKEAVGWLCRAQDGTPDAGVARAYKAAKHRGFGPFGWQASYPETTGYIIPTFFALCDHYRTQEFRLRALRMADWEIEIQMASGSVMGSVVTAPPSPAVFNTGQVILGWIEAYRQSGEPRYLAAASKAGDYLISVQESDGAWRKGNSNFALRDSTVYNTRVAWALISLGEVSGKRGYRDSGLRNIAYALAKQNDQGWFADNCLSDPQQPLLHTIIYAIRGILESGLLLGREDFIECARKPLERLLAVISPEGRMPGRLTAAWQPAVDWDCLTGNCQAAGAWLRLYSVTKDERWRQAARRVVDFVKRTQNVEHTNPGIRGGIKGSFPFDGGYGPFELLNWAVKFYCDALMMLNNETVLRNGIRG